MAKVTKHPRKSGATTIKKDGKIVGNIGQGKTRIPTANTPHSTPTTDTQPYTTIEDAQKRFTIVEDKTYIDFEQCCALWELTSSQPMSDRLNLCENYFINMTDDDQNQFVAHIEQEASADPNIDLWIKQPEEIVELGRVLAGRHGDIPEAVLRKFIFNPELTIDWRKNILLNDSLSHQMLTDISEHNTNPKVAAAIVEHRNSTPKLIQSIYDRERKGKGKSFKVVGTQARSHQDRILSAIARSHKTPRNILSELASSDQEWLSTCPCLKGGGSLAPLYASFERKYFRPKNMI